MQELELRLDPLQHLELEVLEEEVISRLPGVEAQRLVLLNKSWAALLARPGFWQCVATEFARLLQLRRLTPRLLPLCRRQYELRRRTSLAGSRGLSLWPPLRSLAFSKPLFETQALFEWRKTRLVGCGGAGAAVSPCGATLATFAKKSRRITLWRVVDGARLRTVEAEGDVSSLAFSADGASLLFATWRGAFLRRLDSEADSTCFDPGRNVLSAALSSCGGLVATTRLDEGDHRMIHLSLWRSDGQLLRSQRLAGRRGESAAAPSFSPDRSLILTCCGGRPSLWSVTTGQLVRTLTVRGCTDAQRASFSPNGTTILTAHVGHFCIWRLADGARLCTVRLLSASTRALRGRVASASFSPDGSRVMVAWTWRDTSADIIYRNVRAHGDGSAVALWRRAGERWLKCALGGREAHDPRLAAALWMPDGASVITADPDDLVMWLAPGGEGGEGGWREGASRRLRLPSGAEAAAGFAAAGWAAESDDSDGESDAAGGADA